MGRRRSLRQLRSDTDGHTGEQENRRRARQRCRWEPSDAIYGTPRILRRQEPPGVAGGSRYGIDRRRSVDEFHGRRKAGPGDGECLKSDALAVARRNPPASFILIQIRPMASWVSASRAVGPMLGATARTICNCTKNVTGPEDERPCDWHRSGGALSETECCIPPG